MAPPIVLAGGPIKNIYIGKMSFLFNFKPFSLILYVHTAYLVCKDTGTQEERI